MHYIVRFEEDRSYLAIHRHDGVAYDRRRVSVSGEEQIRIEDLSSTTGYRGAENWVYRAMLEEVFPKRNLRVDSVTAREVIEKIRQIRFLSLIYEERFCNFALVCLIQMRGTFEEYRDFYLSAKKPRPDYEGNRFFFKENAVREFFEHGFLELAPFKKELEPIFAYPGRAPENIKNAFALHSSSLFRLWKIAEVFDLAEGNDMESLNLSIRSAK